MTSENALAKMMSEEQQPISDLQQQSSIEPQSCASHSLADNIHGLVDHEKLEGSIEMQSEMYVYKTKLLHVICLRVKYKRPLNNNS
jgi:hypothetical protein